MNLMYFFVEEASYDENLLKYIVCDFDYEKNCATYSLMISILNVI